MLRIVKAVVSFFNLLGQVILVLVFVQTLCKSNKGHRVDLEAKNHHAAGNKVLEQLRTKLSTSSGELASLFCLKTFFASDSMYCFSCRSRHVALSTCITM